ncbi:MAG: hypothetical protein PHO80_03255 [Candidatus Gracilibacteria bacterium]|nr:hypothetical protein [Candidatus Gracilibacteria bacterium]
MDKTTQSIKTAKKPLTNNTTQRYLPFSEIRDNLIVMKDGSSRIILRVNAVNFNLKSIEEQDSIIYTYQRFLNSLRFPIQILVRSLKVDVEDYLNKLKNLAIKQTNPLLQEQTYRYIDFLKNLVDIAQIMKKEFYIVIPFDEEENKSVRDVSFFGTFNKFWQAINQEESLSSIKEKRRRFDHLKKHNMERVNMIKSSLENIGLKSQILKKDELVKLLINYYNPRVNFNTKVKTEVEKLDIQ